MSDLTEFLLARIAEDEAVARAATARNGATWSTSDLSDGTRITGGTDFGNPRAYRGDGELWDDEGAMGMFPETAAHVVRHDPARVLAECDAKRWIVEAYVDMQALGGTERIEQRQTLRWTIELFAVAYVDHPDYREEWKP